MDVATGLKGLSGLFRDTSGECTCGDTEAAAAVIAFTATAAEDAAAEEGNTAAVRFLMDKTKLAVLRSTKFSRYFARIMR